ncbi:MAG: alpha/beta hydrolase [Cellulosilyticaceae bacterium]
MLHAIVNLNEVFTELKGDQGVLHTYIPDNSEEIEIGRKRPSIVVCPGGGYRRTSDREAEPIALRFMAEGYNVFVLRYSVAPNRYPTQLLELSAAVAYIRRNAEAFHVDVNNIAVCGFSAGGHLAGSLGVLWQEPFIAETLKLEEGENRPNKLILSYPVITGGKFAHKGSFDNLLGEGASEEARAKLSLENLVGPLTPPTFIWHTYEDLTVPMKNSLLFADALEAQKVPFELHIYAKGGHGLSLCNESTALPDKEDLINPQTGTWIKLVNLWLRHF